MGRLFHATSSRNRQSIDEHGLDWKWMGQAPGIAGSGEPEAEGIFVCRDEGEVQFFLAMTNTGRHVDVWAIDGPSEADLIEGPEGFAYLPAPIPRQCLALAHRDRIAEAVEPVFDSTAYASTITITLDDGTILRDEDAREWIEGVSRGLS
jgi:hypothetical protein